jgi:hypothetical protein
VPVRDLVRWRIGAARSCAIQGDEICGLKFLLSRDKRQGVPKDRATDVVDTGDLTIEHSTIDAKLFRDPVGKLSEACFAPVRA